ncbi:18939_t:CDS:2, partial [Acaulospora morrowiae]
RLWDQNGYLEWDFGTLQRNSNNPTACNAPGLPAFQINLRVAEVFWDLLIPFPAGYTPAAPPAITATNFSIDLYQIQRSVLRQQGN